MTRELNHKYRKTRGWMLKELEEIGHPPEKKLTTGQLMTALEKLGYRFGAEVNVTGVNR